MTYTEFAATLAGLQVTGIRKAHMSPPTQLNTAQLPAMWPRLPSGESTVVAMAGDLDLPVLRCDLVIAVEPWAQNTQPANYGRALALLDALQVALTDESAEGTVDSWTVRIGGEAIGETAFWAIIATVTGS
jgi:hypothetical protein